MSFTRKKTRTAVIFIIVTALLAALVSVAAGLYNELHETYKDSSDYLESFIDTYDALLMREQDEETCIRSDLKDIAILTVAAIKRSRSEILPSPYADGAIVKVTADGIESPIDLPEEITQEVFSHDSAGTYDTSVGTLIYCHITEDLYYVEMTDQVKKAETAEPTTAAEKSAVSEALEDLAAAHNCEYLYMKTADDSSDYEIYCATGQFRSCSRLSELDISEKDMTAIEEGPKKRAQHLIKIGGSRYFTQFIHVKDAGVAAILMPVKEALVRTAEQTILFVAALMVVCIVLSSWILFIYSAIENHRISPADRDRYHPRSVRNKTRGAVVISTFLILITCLYLQSLESVFTETNNGSAMLTSLFHRIDNDKKRSDKLWKDSQDRYTVMAERVALLIDRNRGLQNRDWLKEASTIIGAEFLMIFDAEGREVISDSSYKGLILGTSETDATYDFRRLLRGVKSISHAGVKDEVLGEKLNMYGISLRYLAEDNAYGALLLAADPNISGKKAFADVNEIAGSMTGEKTICFAADPKAEMIKYSSNRSLLGRKTDVLGLDQNDLREDYMGFITLKGRRYYVISALHDDLLYYYAVRSNRMLGYDVQYALTVSLLAFFLLSFLTHMLLKNFREEEYMASFVSEASSSDEKAAVFYPTSDELMKEKLYSFDFLNKNSSPDERTGSLLLLCVAAVMMATLIRVYSGRHSLGGEGSVLNYIGQGDWDRGINIFAVSSVMVILCQIILILATLKFAASLAGKYLGAKGHTVCTLLYNIVFCITMVVFAIMSLEYFGVNTQALAASFGLAGLAASLGAKDFVSDIIAGITLMTDGSYKVGDTIEIDGFRGTVLKINMRKTTVLQWQGTVKTFSNSTITSVINHSLYPYTCYLTFTIPKGCTVRKAEEIIGREFPKLMNKCPAIIEGPSYIGVSEVKMMYGFLCTTLAVQAVCKHKDRFTVTYFLTKHIKMMFEDEFDEKMIINPPFPYE